MRGLEWDTLWCCGYCWEFIIGIIYHLFCIKNDLSNKTQRCKRHFHSGDTGIIFILKSLCLVSSCNVKKKRKMRRKNAHITYVRGRELSQVGLKIILTLQEHGKKKGGSRKTKATTKWYH